MSDQPYRRIFLLSHMRAYTSLVGHILGSHPDINGYYEMHLSYAGTDDLDRQLREYRQSEPLKPNSVYLFDKLLHNDYRLETSILSPAKDSLLMSVRNPEQSLKSIVHLFRSKQAFEPYADPAAACDYYVLRLESLAAFSRDNPGQYDYYDAGLIKTDSARLLQVLTRWCRLRSALSDQYRTFALTGKARAGDSSGFINTGKIEAAENRYPGVKLEKRLIQRAEQAYNAGRDVMLRNARESLVL